MHNVTFICFNEWKTNVLKLDNIEVQRLIKLQQSNDWIRISSFQCQCVNLIPIMNKCEIVDLFYKTGLINVN